MAFKGPPPVYSEKDIRFGEEAASNYDYVRFTIIDFHGIGRSKTVPKERLSQFFGEGCSFFAGAIGLSLVGPMVPRNVQSIQRTNSGNVFALPQTETLHSLPLNGAGRWIVGEVLCETYFPDGSCQTSNPRTIAKTQLMKLNELGYALKSSWELEVCFVCENSDTPNFDRTIYVFTNSKFDEVEEMMLETEQALRTMGIGIETLQTEATSGQYEFVTYPVMGLKQADNLFQMKEVLRQIARKYKRKAVFMAQPFDSTSGQSIGTALHFNHSLMDRDFQQKHVFFDVQQADHLSDVAKNWLSGILRHAAALTALCSPTVNCYRRLHKSSAPHRANWGLDARMACYRVKNYSPASTYIESRLPSGSANPYLVMAATVAAGIDGLINKYQCPAPIANVMDESAPELPRTLNESLKALDNDEYMMKALGPEFVNWFNLIKQNEIDHFKRFDPDKENPIMLQKEKQCYQDLL